MPVRGKNARQECLHMPIKARARINAEVCSWMDILDSRTGIFACRPYDVCVMPQTATDILAYKHPRLSLTSGGPNPAEISKRIHVNQTTIDKWIVSVLGQFLGSYEINWVLTIHSVPRLRWVFATHQKIPEIHSEYNRLYCIFRIYSTGLQGSVLCIQDVQYNLCLSTSIHVVTVTTPFPSFYCGVIFWTLLLFYAHKHCDKWENSFSAAGVQSVW